MNDLLSNMNLGPEEMGDHEAFPDATLVDSKLEAVPSPDEVHPDEARPDEARPDQAYPDEKLEL